MKKALLFKLLLILVLTGCQERIPAEDSKEISQAELKTSFEKALRAHLDAVEDKNLEAMRATMSPDGELFFMLDGRPLSTTAEAFMEFHSQWFRDTTTVWTISFEILESRVTDELGIAIVETTYREADRDGIPYYNKMHTSYTQKLINDTWYVITDQSSSFEKSTDPKE